MTCLVIGNGLLLLKLDAALQQLIDKLEQAVILQVGLRDRRL